MSFDPNGSRHDMSTYFGRLKYFFDLTDLRNAFLSEKEVNEAKALLTAHASKSLPPSVTDAQLWDAKKSVYHCCESFFFVVLHPSLH